METSDGRVTELRESAAGDLAVMARDQLPTIEIPDINTRATSGSTSPGDPSHQNQHHQRKKVQWPADQDLSRVRSLRGLSPTSPRHMGEQGARDELTRALERHASITQGIDSRLASTDNGTTAHSRDSSRAESNDGDPEERLEQLRERMDVWVDPGETDGMPSISSKTAETKNRKEAWNLIRAHTLGGKLRNRRNTFKHGDGANADGGKPDIEASGANSVEEKPKPDLSHIMSRRRSEPLASSTESAQGMPASGGGILSALIALQRQQQQAGTTGSDSNSVSTSGINTPASLSRRSSFNSEYDSDEEQYEKEKFLSKLRAKRDTKNLFHQAAFSFADAGRSALNLATGHHTPGSKQRPDGAISPTRSSFFGRPASVHSADAALSTGGAVSPKLKDKLDTPALDSLKKVGQRLGLETDARPDAARSGAGVFGGLIMGTANIAGAAAPAATKLAPNPSRPGYHLSRYSHPELSETQQLKTPKSPKLRPASHGGSRPSSPTAGNSPDVTGSSTAHSSPRLTASGEKLPRVRSGFHLNLKDLTPGSLTHPKFGFHSSSRPGSADSSPREKAAKDYFGPKTEKELIEERERREWEKEKRRRRKEKQKRKQEEVFITMHVAAILSRQEFIMKMARAFMMYGAPSHRLEAQMQATARVLEINAQFIYIPSVMLVSFGDPTTHTSEIKFLKQANGLDLGKLLAAYNTYYRVIHDQISVTDASVELDQLMVSPPKYSVWQNILIGGLASAFIQPSAFYGSFIDCLVSIPLGGLLVMVQILISRNDLYSSLFEIVIAGINAFLAAALASTKQFCFAAVASGSVVLILPGYIVLCGALELANRSIISGSVRLVYSVLYSLFLGFGLAIGSEIYQRITGLEITGSNDYTCSSLRTGAPWYKATISPYFYFLTIPAYLLMLALRNGAPMYRKEMPVMIMVGCAGFVANFFSAKAFVGRPDISSACGSFVVGALGNLWGKFTKGSAFVICVVGVLIQLPSGLSNGGLLQFASENANGSSTSYSTGFSTAESLVEVAIGLTVGLFTSTALMNLFGGGRRRGANLFSF